MKRNITLLIFATILFSTVRNELTAQTKLIHYWHFNNTLPTTGAGGIHLGTGPINADYSRYNSGAYIRFTKVPLCIKDTGYIDNNTGDSTNQRVGYGACCPALTATINNSSIRTRNPNDSMEFLWYIPTKNFKNIMIKWGAESSSTGSGPHRENYDYSLDSGLTYMTTGLPRLFDSAGTAWGKISLNLSGLTSINNNSKFMFRIKLGSPNTGASGNNRYDNITVEGDSIGSVPTGISEKTSNTLGYNLYPNPSSDVINISTPFSGMKNISVRNIVGQTLLVSAKEEKEFPIDISQLTKGVYFIYVSDQAGENKATLKFIKN
jgi:hypothetical protein